MTIWLITKANMKTHKLRFLILGMAFAGIQPAFAQTQIITLSTTNGGNLQLSRMPVLPNQIITLLYVSANTNNISFCRVTLTNGAVIYPYAAAGQTFGDGVFNSGQMALTGATNITFASYFDGAATFSITTPSQTQNYIPANAVVIPTDATGNVQIVLESSSDLVNWNAALPGTYGSTYSNRFFRVRVLAGQ